MKIPGNKVIIVGAGLAGLSCARRLMEDGIPFLILHALPEQPPPMPDPTVRPAAVSRGIYVCGEYGSVPGIQWALLSGRQAAEQVLKDLDTHR